MLPIWTIATLLLSTLAHAQILEGTVTLVPSPTTIVVRDPTKSLYIVRLSGVRSPSSKTTEYKKAKAFAAKRLLNRSVSVNWDQKEAVCRSNAKRPKCPVVGKLIVDGQDIALELLSRGLAQQTRDRLDELSTTDRTLYTEAESKAKLEQRGIWTKKMVAKKRPTKVKKKELVSETAPPPSNPSTQQ